MNESIHVLTLFKKKAEAFEAEAHRTLAKHEVPKSRVVSLDKARKRLSMLSLQQDSLFEQAIMCAEREVHRAAHVMAWAGFMDYLEQKLASDGLVKVKSVKPGWVKYGSIEEIRENVAEHQLIEAARDVGLLSKSEAKTILGLLSKRNECAHPSNCRPSMNESLGYIDELLRRIQYLHTRAL